jgi:hypothetical protein
MRRGKLADRGEGAGAMLRQGAAERLRGLERVRTGDSIGVDRPEIRLGLTEREPERVADEATLISRVANTRRTRLAVR